MLCSVLHGLLEINMGHFLSHSEPVERRYSWRKLKLEALCFERKRDWEACLHAAMLTLKSAPARDYGCGPSEACL